MAPLKPPRWVVDVAAVVVAVADAMFGQAYLDRSDLVVAVIACAALLLRRRWPLLVFMLTLPTALTGLIVAPAVALYTVGRQSREKLMVLACAVTVALVSAATSWWPSEEFGSHADALVYAAFTAAWAAAPVLFGLLMRTRDELARRLVEIEEVRDHERDLHTQAVLARERAQIGREMHDVVSHQVSLIAVRAGALAVATPDPQTREAARTIRGLSVTTLDELRSLVMLLRASGSGTTELTPQPTLADLQALIDSCGIAVTLTGTLPEGISGAAQRAVFRTVQEALTNVRKHAPGAAADVSLWSDEQWFGVIVVNSPPTRHALSLPGSSHGLLGLAERAELLNGQLRSAATEAGGFRVELRLPRL